MSDDDKVIMWLDSFEFLTYKKKEILLQIIDRPSDYLSKSTWDFLKSEILKIISISEFNDILLSLDEDSIKFLEAKYNRLNIKYITIFSKVYPEKLKNIDSPPLVLYYKGDISLLNQEGFAVVGTRNITNYGKMATEKFVKGLVDAGFVIVSGLASGVDTISHQTSLDCHGKTIAVLAGGIDEIYPSTNKGLAEKIVASNGLVISETRPLRKADSYMFPIRNRIIAGLSSGVLITEAQEKSGVIYTKNYALDYGRNVFSVPGSIFSIKSVGTNRIIANGQAKAVLDIQDILDEYDISFKKKIKAKENFSIDESVIIEFLRQGEKTFQEIADYTKFEIKTLNSLLTTLLIRGIIKKLVGNTYYIVD